MMDDMQEVMMSERRECRSNPLYVVSCLEMYSKFPQADNSELGPRDTPETHKYLGTWRSSRMIRV
jgi:hypothetical protein